MILIAALVQIWDCEGVSDTMDVAVSASLARAVEAIISQYSWFFQNDASHFPSWDHQLPVSLACLATPLPDSSHLATPSYTPARSRAHTSPQPNTRWGEVLWIHLRTFVYHVMQIYCNL